MIFIAGGALAFFFEFLLLSKKNKTLADILLAAWMLILGLHLTLYYFSYTRLDFKYTFLLGYGIPFPFLHGPMLFLYTAALTGRLPRWKNIHFLHFIPFLFFYFYYFDFFISSSEEKFAYIDRLKGGEIDIYMQLHYPLMVISALTYLALTFLMIRRHQKNIEGYFSYSSEWINLHWLRNLLIGMAIVWAVVITVNAFKNEFADDVPIYVTVVLFVISMGYFGIRQGNIFTTTPGTSEMRPGVKTEALPLTGSEAIQKRYAKSGLKDNEADTIEARLKILMEKDKLYLEESLTLPKLAVELDILPNYLSQVINERYGKNFYDFINTFRVEEFKEIVRDPKKKHYTLLTLAMECGFNSKSSFNKYFKKATGKTPSEYIEALN